MNEQPTTPTIRQLAYLRHLAARAHDAGMPHLHVASFTREDAAAWIDYLRLVVDAEDRVREILDRAKREAEQSAPPYLLTPPRDRAPDGYRPPYALVPEGFDHEHRLDCYLTADDHEIVYCTLCGGEW